MSLRLKCSGSEHRVVVGTLSIGSATADYSHEPNSHFRSAGSCHSVGEES
jgi:hypothetical protein